MTRQDQIYKWFCYALGLFPVWVLDTLLVGRYPIFHTVPNLLPLAVTAVAVLEGTCAGVGFGMAVGLVWALGCPGGHGMLVLGMALAGLFSGAATQYGLTQNFLGCLICSGAVLTVTAILQVAWGLFIQLAPASLLLEIAGRELLASLAWTPAVYLIFWLVYRRVGGEKLA